MVLLLRLPSRCSLALDAWLAFQGFFSPDNRSASKNMQSWPTLALLLTEQLPPQPPCLQSGRFVCVGALGNRLNITDKLV
jgi:hypothetical protein